jgi:hypothetical protein
MQVSGVNLSRVINVRLGSSPACREACRERLPLRAKLPLVRGNGRSRAGGPETARKKTVILAGSKGNP